MSGATQQHRSAQLQPGLTLLPMRDQRKQSAPSACDGRQRRWPGTMAWTCCPQQRRLSLSQRLRLSPPLQSRELLLRAARAGPRTVRRQASPLQQRADDCRARRRSWQFRHHQSHRRSIRVTLLASLAPPKHRVRRQVLLWSSARLRRALSGVTASGAQPMLPASLRAARPTASRIVQLAMCH